MPNGAIGMALEILPEHKFSHQRVLVSGSDCVSDENNKIMVLVSLLIGSFWKFHFNQITDITIAIGSIVLTTKILKQ